MLAKFLRSYFDEDLQVHLIGMQSGILALIIAYLGIKVYAANQPTVIILLGLMTTSMMLVQNYMAHNSLQRLHFGFGFALAGSLVFSSANLVAGSPIYSSIALLVSAPLIAILNGHQLLNSFIFYLVYVFILGLGFKVPSHASWGFGGYFFSGSILIVLGGYLRVFIRKRFFDLAEELPFVKFKVMLTKQRPQWLYLIVLTVTIVVSNLLSAYLNHAHAYWLPMTALLLLRSDHRLTFKRSCYRIIGSLLGVGLAGLFILSLGSGLLIAMLLPLFYLLVITINRHYIGFCVVVTLVVLATSQLAFSNSRQLLSERLLITGLAAALVVAAALLIKYLPQRQVSK